MKGSYGNIRSRRKRAIYRSLFFAGFSLAVFLTGLFLTHTTRNFLSIVAAIGAIPTALSVVNLVLFIKAKSLPQEAYEEIERHRGGLLIRYELEMTSYERTYHISAACVMDKSAAFYTADENADTDACTAHIKEQLSLGGYPDMAVVVFKSTQLAEFCERLDQLEKLRAVRHINPAAIEDAWQPGTTQTPAGILLSISL